jgi:hypothetical protein
MLEAWLKVEDDRFFEGNAAMSWTWKQMQIAPGQVITRSAIILFSLPDQNTLQLHITSSLPDVIHATDTLHVSGTVTSSDPNAQLSLMVVVGRDPSTIFHLAENVPHSFSISFPATDLLANSGAHELEFFVADGHGSLSNGEWFYAELIFPIHTPTQSTSRSRTPSRSSSPTLLRSRQPAPTKPPAHAIPLVPDCDGSDLVNFHLTAHGGNTEMSTTLSGEFTHWYHGERDTQAPFQFEWFIFSSGTIRVSVII